jgi:serine/threonine-protein kinase
VLFWHDRDPVGAERELRRAIQLNPNCAMAHFQCGMLFADLNRANESVAAFQRALQLDPVSCWNSAIAGMFLVELGHEAAGKELLQKALDLDPYFFFTRQVLAGVHWEENKFAEAITAAQEAVRLSGGLPATRGWEAFYLAVGGRRAEALEILDQLQQLSHERYVPATARMCCYLGLGDHERAITWLETGYEQRDSLLPHIAALRAFKPLHPDPRFLDVLQRLGVAPK